MACCRRGPKVCRSRRPLQPSCIQGHTLTRNNAISYNKYQTAIYYFVYTVWCCVDGVDDKLHNDAASPRADAAPFPAPLAAITAHHAIIPQHNTLYYIICICVLYYMMFKSPPQADGGPFPVPVTPLELAAVAGRGATARLLRRLGARADFLARDHWEVCV